MAFVIRAHAQIGRSPRFGRERGAALLLVLLINALLVALLLAGWQLQQYASQRNSALRVAYQNRLDELSLINLVGGYLASGGASPARLCLSAAGQLSSDCGQQGADLTGLDYNLSFADGSEGEAYQLSADSLRVTWVVDSSAAKAELYRQSRTP